ncbi:MAG: tRNA (adenosine(37)-N6)-dimethylallyltransferase MiaA [Parcubacteria group bacterium]|nr:tRNA (adenosine(37)-N6)-dimethylallyltransferase MiaA [Parcubacteria group bacterium]
MPSSLPKIIAIVGTTASGKTALAVELAREFNGEIVSVDSRQIYEEMDIGTNKEVAEGVKHHMINLVKPDEVLTLGQFKTMAQAVIDNILSRGKLPVLVGGTSLYTTAILRNWQIPAIEPDSALRAELEALTTDELATRLSKLNPDKAAQTDLHNRRRLVRAIEVEESASVSGSSLPAQGPQKYNALLIAPAVDLPSLYERINTRFDAMMAAGLLDEVKTVGEKYGYDSVAMTGHGYQQLGGHLQGRSTLAEAVEVSKKATRAYAKRQLTWWRKYGPVQWVQSKDQAVDLVRYFLNS